ncbi:unnamed protein product [Wuchereria bancrofti]|uniref:Uncharacterized protein n=1 Tax=Wuchereria bancrofti TaxID=6293 RepID=A0A3P7EVN0_WUCBA|nr:unnamed protein product [Wuchereria bancrofti]
MPSKSVSASMTAMPSTSGSTELAASSQHRLFLKEAFEQVQDTDEKKKAQVIFLQRSPKLIISRNGGEAVQHFILTQQPIVNGKFSFSTKFGLLKGKVKAKLVWVEIFFF